MKARYKMTGCARFLIFLLILAPIAYFGSKYLMESGTWDKIKDKIENEESSPSGNSTGSNDNSISIPSNDAELRSQFERLRAAYEEQELVLTKQNQTIKNLQEENEALRKRINDPALGRTTPSTASPTSTQSDRIDNSQSSGSPSLDDLLAEADSNLGTSSENSSNTPGSGSRISLGEWNFQYSGMSGVIEFFSQNGTFFSRITAKGDNRVNIDELSRSGDRFDVKNSQTGEYYIVLKNGNLEAYDRTGYQTTCTRR